MTENHTHSDLQVQKKRKIKKEEKSQVPVAEHGPMSDVFKCTFRVWKGTGSNGRRRGWEKEVASSLPWEI